ncbi:tryptophan synthase beta subunit-like PLP-dependent enzyme [Gaertneriomyces semiglobifer]|nr:tryptophan synthase beta subunit-like PLP-dependent enzyme [Gaertneriomyces semiglobifer]
MPVVVASQQNLVALAFLVGATVASLPLVYCFYKQRAEDKTRSASSSLSSHVKSGIEELIGNTPLLYIKSLSAATGCTILGKCEFLNIGGSAKDRVALGIIQEAERLGLIRPHQNDTLYEGTVGSTGISLAVIAKAKGYRCHICMPDDQAQEKYDLLEKYGATVEKLRPVSIVDKNHYVNVAKRRAEEVNALYAKASDPDSHDLTAEEREIILKNGRALFCDQFENLANYQIHYRTTGPEIYTQTSSSSITGIGSGGKSGDQISALVLGAGTGGTLAGLTSYLKPRLPGLRIVLADPQGSGLFHKIKHGIMYSPTEREGSRKRHQVDTVVEGIGINRVTRNFGVVERYVDDAVRVSDREAVEMSRWLVKEDGLFIGSSSAVNLVATYRTAKALGPGHTLVTLLNDHGTRHLTKFWNDAYIEKAGLTPTAVGLEFLDD